VVELIVVWAWHAPAAHHAARSSAAGLIAEQGMFLCAGFLVWMASLGGQTGVRPWSDPIARNRAGAGVVALLLTSMHMTLLGALVAMSPRALYAHAPTPAALDDQHLGGAIMLLVGGIVYLAGGLWLSAGLLLDPPLGRRREVRP
jgi:putative membrane protein